MKAPGAHRWRLIGPFLVIVGALLLFAPDYNWRHAVQFDDLNNHADWSVDISPEAQAPTNNPIVAAPSQSQVASISLTDPALKFAWIDTQPSALVVEAIENQFTAPPSRL